ncbi:MAG: hypothetical protein KKC79_01555 [Gammaproteobacteria bacterium]|nr:hypothetical protein [Gammaproteobacteria bacterium]MBU1440829.1 hypothetical protein [Gammaproteobacteria bacterium]MBU2285832.1 hypothetical protein [Gammaproteobacteria bacterium]MBU2407316.1 hypothetical protein [Gammaproteobacteria bacterium]
MRHFVALSVLAIAAAGVASSARAEQAWARVVSATPVTESTGNIRYNVTYEYEGQQYTTRTDTQPGSRLPIQVGDYGVATTAPVAPQARLAPQPTEVRPDWNNVVPEQGVVVSSGAPAPVYAQPAPVYAQPAPIYYPAPVYVQPSYGYAPYVYPPVGISLGIGYSRGWGGGHHRGHWR